MSASVRPAGSRPAPDVIATVELPGPWVHSRVSAHGARFHVAEALPAGPDATASAPASTTASTRPLVLLLHGFPQFWWAWRHQLPMLAEAGFRAVAMDLRGYGGSDKTPRGYDPVTLSDDVAGVIGALGADSAYVVGHGWGGLVGWAVAVSHQPLIKGLVASAAPHPLRMRAPGRVLGAQLSHAGHILAFQAPWFPERALIADEAALVGRLLRRWSAPGSAFPSAEEERRYRDAMRIWPAPHCALEYHRWLVRSYWRTDGRRFVGRLKQPVQVPVLQVHGAADRSVLPETARGSDRYVRAPYRWAELPGVGHFPHEEAPAALGQLLVGWLREQERAG
jgi:pimeloyl-ACP methyl ester carboxylesterase